MSSAAFDLAAHPLRQLAAHLGATPRPAPSWLGPAEARLFQRMPAPDQVEGLAVVRRLRLWGYADDGALLSAGLLHDVGKSLAPPAAGYRMAITAIERLPARVRPGLVATMQPLRILWGHAHIGAELAAQEGLRDDVVALIRDHHAPAGNERMRALQHADGLY